MRYENGTGRAVVYMYIERRKVSEIEIREKWECPAETGVPLITMPNVPRPLHACLRGDAEVLTSTGWKKICEVTTNDTVATWDRDTEKIVWDCPYETIKTYSKQLVRITFDKYKTFGMLVTPNHRIPVRKKSDGRVQKDGVRSRGESKWVIVDKTAASINLGQYQHFITAAVNGSDSGSALSDLERVYIATQADGSLRYEAGGEYTYRFSFKKQRKKDRFASLCQSAGVKFNKYNHEASSYASMNGIQKFDVVVDRECKNLWHCFDLTTFSQLKAQQFIDEISLWDGSCAETCGILNRRYVTTSLDNAKFAQAVAVIAGVTSSFQVEKRSEEGTRRGTCYVVDFLDRSYRTSQSCRKTVEDHDDYVYCINVATSYFVVRDADTQSVMITGNCAPRKIMGDSTWNHVRKRCYFNAGYKCEICGIDPPKGQLAAHELYSYDYKEGVGKFERCIAICKRDHDFIHSGRLITMYKNGNVLYPKSYVLGVVEKGFKLIHNYNETHKDEKPLRAYATFLEYLKVPELAEEMSGLIDKYKIDFYSEPKRIAKWADWKLLFGNKEYPTPYANQGEWVEAMAEASKNDNVRAIDNPFTGDAFDEINKILKGESHNE